MLHVVDAEPIASWCHRTCRHSQGIDESVFGGRNVVSRRLFRGYHTRLVFGYRKLDRKRPGSLMNACHIGNNENNRNFHPYSFSEIGKVSRNAQVAPIRSTQNRPALSEVVLSACFTTAELPRNCSMEHARGGMSLPMPTKRFIELLHGLVGNRSAARLSGRECALETVVRDSPLLGRDFHDEMMSLEPRFTTHPTTTLLFSELVVKVRNVRYGLLETFAQPRRLAKVKGQISCLHRRSRYHFPMRKHHLGKCLA
jgi:hypothetical protein